MDDPDIIKELSSFIGTDKKLATFLHRLRDTRLAEKIMHKGFMFENHLGNTTDHVSPDDIIELTYFINIRRAYGKVAIVIQINNELIESINRKLVNSGSHFSEVLTKYPPVMGYNEMLIYTLPAQFIMGFFDTESGKQVANPDFNPYYETEVFDRNIELILKK